MHKLYQNGDKVAVNGYEVQIDDSQFNPQTGEYWYMGIDYINGMPREFSETEVTKILCRATPVEQMEPLPPDITFYEREDPQLWINCYIEYASKVSPMTPRLFHESAALALAGTAIARRIKLSMAWGNIYPNLFIAWIAETTIFNKSTALDIARGLARRIMPYLITPNAVSPEALIADMAGEYPTNYNTLSQTIKNLVDKRRNFAAQKGLIADELSSLLVLSRKDYGSGILEAFMKFYDCDPDFDQSSKTKGLTVLKNTSLTLLGATTPAAINDFLGKDEMWSNGFWPRFALLTPEVEKPNWAEAIETDEPYELGMDLSALVQNPKLDTPIFPQLAKEIDANIDQDAFNLWKQYDKAVRYDLLNSNLEHRLFGTYGRLPAQVLKIALILATLEWTSDPAPRINLDHIAHAIAIAEKWRASAHRALEMGKETAFTRVKSRIVRQLRKPEILLIGLSFRDLTRNLKDIKPNDLKEALEQLVMDGTVTMQGSQGRGRPTDRYLLV